MSSSFTLFWGREICGARHQVRNLQWALKCPDNVRVKNVYAPVMSCAQGWSTHLSTTHLLRCLSLTVAKTRSHVTNWVLPIRICGPRGTPALLPPARHVIPPPYPHSALVLVTRPVSYPLNHPDIDIYVKHMLNSKTVQNYMKMRKRFRHFAIIVISTS